MTTKMHHSLAVTCLIIVCFITSASFAQLKEMVYWTDKDTAMLQRASRQTGLVENILTGQDGLVEPRGLELDVANGKMYFADSGTGKIHRANLDGSEIEILIEGLFFVSDLAIDLSKGHLYWTDTGAGKIQRVNIHTDDPVEDVVTGVPQPYYITLDTAGGKIYWADVNNTVIHRTDIDGDGPVEDFITGLSRVRDIAIDFRAQKIYWGDRESSTIQRANLDGTGIEVLYGPWHGLDRPHGLSLDLAAGKIYWTDTRTLDIRRGDMDGSGPFEVFASGLDGPWEIVVISITPDYDTDGDVDLGDFAILSEHWLEINEGANLADEDTITLQDLLVFVKSWME